jgi:hypothetical protein
MLKQKRKMQNKQSWDRASWLLFLLPIFAMILTIVTLIDIHRVEDVSDVVDAYRDLLEEDRHPLTGEIVDEAVDVLPQVFGVMVENAADAWPLSGLDKAFLVIEAPVEAGIPRFLVLFEEDVEVEKVGPVRSARPYYLDWALGLDAIYGHVGGSPEALDLIASLGVIDVNQFFESEYFYRQTWGGRYAPHNVYTDGELLRGILDEFELDAPVYDFWKFADGESKGNSSAAIDFADGTTYDMEWEYDEETNQYQRMQGGGPVLMSDGAAIYADNVLVMATDIRTIDAVGRKELLSVGTGDAYILQNGEGYLGVWEKESHESQLRFLTTDGYEISMNAGVTWIEVVDGLDQAELYEAGL